jgi:hypothetical protein
MSEADCILFDVDLLRSGRPFGSRLIRLQLLLMARSLRCFYDPTRPHTACHGTNPKGQLRVEAVRKPREFLQTIAQSEIFRDFFASKRSEGSKK